MHISYKYKFSSTYFAYKWSDVYMSILSKAFHRTLQNRSLFNLPSQLVKLRGKNSKAVRIKEKIGTKPSFSSVISTIAFKHIHIHVLAHAHRSAFNKHHAVDEAQVNTQQLLREAAPGQVRLIFRTKMAEKSQTSNCLVSTRFSVFALWRRRMSLRK